MAKKDIIDLKVDFAKYFFEIQREGKPELFKYLEESGYFTAPSSTQYHGAEEAGNFEHSINVVETMLKLKAAIAPEVTTESICIVGLFHDLGKCDYFGKPNYVPNILKGGEKSKSKPYETNKERLGLPHEIVSLHILSRFIPLTEEEVHAIVFHNGLYVGLGRELKGNETKLQQLLHTADMWASRFLETDASVSDIRRLF